MAANVPVLTAAKKEEETAPLASFERVSKIAYLYRPPTTCSDRNPSDSLAASASASASPSPSPSPRLILVGGWMDAREPHLAKYTARLQALYPDAPILLVRSFAHHFTGSRFPAELEPAVPLIRSLAGGGSEEEQDELDHGTGAAGGEGQQQPRMLVHVFSNGGSTMLRLLYDAYARSSSSGGAPRLPAHVTVFDSAPGRFSFGRSVTAFTLPFARRPLLVRMFWRVVMGALCGAYWLLLHVPLPWGSSGPGGSLERTWAVHNDRTKNAAEVRRAYVYSEEDQLVDHRDVEEHAAEGRRRGFEVRLEKFRGTAHVAHARGDEERYWRVVRDTWEGRV